MKTTRVWQILLICAICFSCLLFVTSCEGTDSASYSCGNCITGAIEDCVAWGCGEYSSCSSSLLKCSGCESFCGGCFGCSEEGMDDCVRCISCTGCYERCFASEEAED